MGEWLNLLDRGVLSSTGLERAFARLFQILETPSLTVALLAAILGAASLLYGRKLHYLFIALGAGALGAAIGSLYAAASSEPLAWLAIPILFLVGASLAIFLLRIGIFLTGGAIAALIAFAFVRGDDLTIPMIAFGLGGLAALLIYDIVILVYTAHFGAGLLTLAVAHAFALLDLGARLNTGGAVDILAGFGFRRLASGATPPEFLLYLILLVGGIVYQIWDNQRPAPAFHQPGPSAAGPATPEPAATAPDRGPADATAGLSGPQMAAGVGVIALVAIAFYLIGVRAGSPSELGEAAEAERVADSHAGPEASWAGDDANCCFGVRNVPDDDVLNVRNSPGANARLNSTLAPDAGGVAVLECVAPDGTPAPRDWIVRRPENAPRNIWCRIRDSVGATGWVNAHYLGADRRTAGATPEEQYPAVCRVGADSYRYRRIVDYYAEINEQDQVNSRYEPIYALGAVLRQDRANFHRFNAPGPNDEGDGLMESAQTRGLFQSARYAKPCERGYADAPAALPRDWAADPRQLGAVLRVQIFETLRGEHILWAYIASPAEAPETPRPPAPEPEPELRIGPLPLVRASAKWEDVTSASLAIDGDEETTYSSGEVHDFQRDPMMWWQVDLGAVRDVRRVRVCWDEVPAFKTIRIRGSMDGEDFDPIIPERRVNVDGRWSEFEMDEDIRYVRIYLSDSGEGGHGMDISEVEVWGVQAGRASGVSPTSPTELALINHCMQTFNLDLSSLTGRRFERTAVGIDDGVLTVIHDSRRVSGQPPRHAARSSPKSCVSTCGTSKSEPGARWTRSASRPFPPAPLSA
jgi:hypothetical protein